MITANLFGGACNNLFIIAATIAHSLKHGIPYCIPTSVINPHYEGQKPYYSPHITYCDTKPKGVNCYYNEPFFHYQSIPTFDGDNQILNGYFQSWKYHYEYKAEILKVLALDDIKTMEGVCSLHYRSGDYKLYPNIHPVISREYILSSIVIMRYGGYKKFLIFSDDITEIKEILSYYTFHKEISIEYSEGKNEVEDLKLMASCASNICANSSFSYWAAYINPNPEKVIIMPRNWFGKDLDHNTKDLYLPNSIVI